jgi:hypothetical protein
VHRVSNKYGASYIFRKLEQRDLASLGLNTAFCKRKNRKKEEEPRLPGIELSIWLHLNSGK